MASPASADEALDGAMGQREQRQRIEQWQREQQRRAPVVGADTPTVWQAPAADEKLCFVIYSVRVVLADAPAAATGSEAVAALPVDRAHAQRQLGPVHPLRGFEGSCLGAESIRRLRDNLQGRLLAHGFITSALYVPPQDLRNGEVLLALEPGHVNPHYLGDLLGLQGPPTHQGMAHAPDTHLLSSAPGAVGADPMPSPENAKPGTELFCRSVWQRWFGTRR